MSLHPIAWSGLRDRHVLFAYQTRSLQLHLSAGQVTSETMTMLDDYELRSFHFIDK